MQEQVQQVQQVFNFSELTGPEVEAIMVALNELPAKTSRAVMNKLEGQIIEQVRAQSASQTLQKARGEKTEAIKAGLSD